ncbi:MAG: chitobiase/beta-hexosaminidase C-terminal domain-containing protein [Muribaculaceae bacterium]|nr:chitobiase/beta-hexosaminidase C-terminal domain-containing protein [Muribaculaceae bacterium]
MKKLLLSLLCLMGLVAAQAGVADLNTMNGGTASTTYSTYTSAAGWTAVNSNILNNSKGQTAMLPVDTLAVNMNGRTTKVGSLTSPSLTGGIGTLTFNYGYTYNESNGVSLTVNILQNDEVVKSVEVVNTSALKNTAYESISDINISGDFVIRIDNNSPSNSTSNRDRFSVWNIQWTEYSGSTLEQAETPVIAPEEGEITSATEISITCATDGAAIYYTTDGTNPSADNGILYSAPFTLDKTATVKAIAVADGYSNSSIASASYIVPFSVANIAEFIAAADTQTPVTISGAVTAVYMNGRNLYVRDDSGAILIYDKNDVVTDAKYSNGDLISGITGVYALQNGLPELIPAADLADATEGTAVEPAVVTIGAITSSMLSQYVKIEKVSIAAASSANNYTMTDADSNSFAIYNTFYNSTYYNTVTVPEGDNITVVGFVGCYNSTLQITPTECIVDQTIAQTPVITPEGGQITTDDVITITCTTEGASIYYTLDGTAPSAENGILYTEPFSISEDCTVKAIAIMEGITDSEIAEAVFTIKTVDPNETTATFDFTDPSSLTPAQETPATSSGIAVNDVVFTAGSVSLTASKGSASTDCRLWGGTSAVDFRTYKNSTITISGTNAKLVSIEFTGNKASTTQLSAGNGSFSGSTWTATEEVSSVTFTTTATTNISTITVNYNVNTGIENVDSEDTDAPAEYYNLQGVKVANPENGLYIRVQGNKATKILVK